jgi:hypothetical protein
VCGVMQEAYAAGSRGAVADSAFEGHGHNRQLATYEEERERRPLYRDPDLHLLVRAPLHVSLGQDEMRLFMVSVGWDVCGIPTPASWLEKNRVFLLGKKGRGGGIYPYGIVNAHLLSHTH